MGGKQGAFTLQDHAQNRGHYSIAQQGPSEHSTAGVITAQRSRGHWMCTRAHDDPV